MKKIFAWAISLVLALALCAVAGCAPATAPAAEQTAAPAAAQTEAPAEAPTAEPQPTAEPAPAPTEAISDVEPLLYLTRGEIVAQYGTGEPQPFADIADYNESGYALAGFPCAYGSLKGVTVFYLGKPMAEDSAPYYCTESSEDEVEGLMLPPGSEPMHVRDMTASLKPEQVKEVEHVDGMYEYYRIIVNVGNLQFEWHSDNEDMSDSTLYVSQLPSEE